MPASAAASAGCPASSPVLGLLQPLPGLAASVLGSVLVSPAATPLPSGPHASFTAVFPARLPLPRSAPACVGAVCPPGAPRGPQDNASPEHPRRGVWKGWGFPGRPHVISADSRLVYEPSLLVCQSVLLFTFYLRGIVMCPPVCHLLSAFLLGPCGIQAPGAPGCGRAPRAAAPFSGPCSAGGLQEFFLLRGLGSSRDQTCLNVPGGTNLAFPG